MNPWEAVVTAFHAVRFFLFSLFYESYAAQIALILLLCFWPRILLFVRRVRLFARLRKICRARGFSLVAHRRLFFLGNFRHADCEFSVVTRTRAFAVKLVGLRRRNRSLRFLTETDLEIASGGRLIGAKFSSAARRSHATRMPATVKWHPHPAWSFFTHTSRALPTECILLCHPTPKRVVYRRRCDTADSNRYEFVPLEDGVRFWDMTYYTPEGFCKLLEEIREGYTLYTE